VQFAPFLKMYSQYASNSEQSLRLLAELRGSGSGSGSGSGGNARFQAFCQQQEGEARCRGQTLESLLIMPIQRVPRYQLLLAELRRQTPAGHADEAQLVRAEEVVGATARHINEHVRARQNHEALLGIQAELGNEVDLLAPHRQFVRRGPLVKVCRASDVHYEFILFSDMLLYASRSVLKLKVRLSIYLLLTPIQATLAVQASLSLLPSCVDSLISFIVSTFSLSAIAAPLHDHR
jgi:hypothetical protein